MKSSLKKHVNTVFGVLVGNAILAFTVVAFIVPHGVIMGGATGIGLTIAHYVPVDLSIIIFIVNSILFVLGATVLGKKFAVATIASTFIYPTFLSIVQKIPGIDGLTEHFMQVRFLESESASLCVWVHPPGERILWLLYLISGFIFRWQGFCMS